MLTNLSDYDSAYSHFLSEAMRGFLSESPLFSQFERHSTEHSGPIRNVPRHQQQAQPMTNSEFGAETTLDALRNTDIDAHTQFVYSLSDAQKGVLGPLLIETINQVTNATGNVIDGLGKSFYDTQLDGIEKVEVSFDEEGNAGGLTILMNPKTAEMMRNLPPPTAEQNQRYEDIMARKRLDYYAKKRTRRLP